MEVFRQIRIYNKRKLIWGEINAVGLHDLAEEMPAHGFPQKPGTTEILSALVRGVVFMKSYRDEKGNVLWIRWARQGY